MPTRKSNSKTVSRNRARPARTRRWSSSVSKESDALDLQPGIFKSRSARSIALSLKRSADASRRRKSSPFRSAMSMLNFEINRGGRGLSETRREVLNRAKNELRKVYGRPAVEMPAGGHQRRANRGRKSTQ